MSKRNSSQKELAAALATVLGDTYVLAVKSHAFHWNVTGMDFVQLHGFFQEQYTSLHTAADDVAERIRGLGALAPASMARLLETSNIKEATAKTLSAKEMLTDLVGDNEVVIADISAARTLAQQSEDSVTEDLLNQRQAAHEKTLWMLRALLA